MHRRGIEEIRHTGHSYTREKAHHKDCGKTRPSAFSRERDHNRCQTFESNKGQRLPLKKEGEKQSPEAGLSEKQSARKANGWNCVGRLNKT